MTSFSESRLELFPTKWQVTVSFDTLILENKAGAEMRYSRIVEPRFSFSASDMILTKDEYDYLKAFFEARKGKFQGFRFTNPLDYQTSAVEVELATGITTQGILIETATAGEYQLVKRYTVEGVSCYKTIRKIKQVLSGPTINLNSGIATSGGAVSCEYDLMVRFDQDEIELTHITVESEEYGSIDAYRVVGIQLVEDNYPKVYSYVESDFADLDFTFVPSPLPEVTKGTNTVTRIEASQSQKETRITFSENKAIYKFGNNVLYQPEVNIFYTLFLACMGRKKAFTYDGVGVRFSSDQLTLTLEVWDGNNSVWQLSGLEVVATKPFIAPPPPIDYACRISAPYINTLSIPYGEGISPRESGIASFLLSDYQGDILTASSFSLDDIAFIVPADFDSNSAYSMNGATRNFAIPPSALIIYDGNNSNYSNGNLGGGPATNYIFNGNTIFVPNEPISAKNAIEDLISAGVPGQPHNSISLLLLESKGYVFEGTVTFKIVHLNHGGGNLSFGISIPACDP